MKIAIDVGAVPYGRGISRYTTNLVAALSKIKNADLRLFGSSWRQKQLLKDFSVQTGLERQSVFWPYPPSVMQILWNDWHVASPESELGFPDIFHSWEYQPPLRNAALVSTIHDLAMLRFPETAHPELLRVHKSSWKRLKQEAKAIIAVSQSTKRDIVELLNIDESRVHVVLESLPKESKAAIKPQQIPLQLAQLRIDRPYILFVGTTEPRKNLRRLIEAWKPLSKDCDLVIAGAQGWESLPSLPHLKVLGQVNAMQLAALYAGARLFAYPSLYEGFGLPILEAFYYGAPVLTSNTSSMPEVAADAAAYCNPMEVESIRKGIEQGLQHRKKFIRAGNRRLEFFSWKKVAKETMQVYETARQA